MAPRVRRKLKEFSARGTPRNRDPREEAMQKYAKFKREDIDTDQRIGFEASIDETPILSQSVRTVENIGKKYLPSISGGVQRGLDALTGAWNEAQGARRDDEKWTLGGDELDITRGSDAYKYLLTQIDPEYKDDFRREVGKNNLHWTELNEYAGDNAPGLAKKINEYNSGIRSFPKGEDVYSNFVRQGSDLEGTGMIGDAAARIADAQKEGRAGFATPAARDSVWAIDDFITTPPPTKESLSPFDDTVKFVEETVSDMPGYVYGPERQEGLDWDFDSERKMRLYLDQQEKAKEAEYTNVNPLRSKPWSHYWQMEGPSDPLLPPFLSGDTDWWTPEPEEEDLRGWDWINEPVMRHYGVDRPSEEIEREWPNTPPPAYRPLPPWWSRAWDWLKEGDYTY